VIGQFVAKAMLDSRIIDLSFNKIFVKLILGEEVPLTIATLKVTQIRLLVDFQLIPLISS
jgi:E3 ubiquitin-protein ligase TRIP12